MGFRAYLSLAAKGPMNPIWFGALFFFFFQRYSVYLLKIKCGKTDQHNILGCIYVPKSCSN